MVKRWVLVKTDEQKTRELAAKGQISSLAAKALVMRGCDDITKAAAFFGQDSTERYSSPSCIQDMDKAAGLISEAAENGTLICVYGDYDCDGITATALFADYLNNIGANVTTYINERSEGYGINSDAIRRLAAEDVGMIVTVDNGIAALEEAKLCKELGITLIVTDHHQPGDELPCAAAVVDPHRSDDTAPYEDLCGCGLAMKLVAAMEGGDSEFAAEQYGDLAALATVADIVPLNGENRSIVVDGMRCIKNTERPGLAALIEKAGIKNINSTSIAFGLAPKINAAGRIASPRNALDLLMSEDEETAAELADKVIALNTRRQSLTDSIYADIAEQIARDPALLSRRVLVFTGEGWHHGVIGIAAAKLVELFDKPAFVITAEPDGLRGSARAVTQVRDEAGCFNVFDSLVYAGEFLTKKGGHAGAGGFSLERAQLDGFVDALEEYAASLPRRTVTEIIACADITPDELTEENVSGLSILEPYGEKNPKPVFLLSDCTVKDVLSMSEGAHTKLVLEYCGRRLDAPMFGVRTESFPYKAGDRLNILVNLDINEYNGRRSIQLRILDIRMKGMKQEKLISSEDYHDKFVRGEITEQELLRAMTPTRDDLAVIYRSIDTPRTPLDAYSSVSCVSGTISYCKFLTALDIFSEAGLIAYDRFANSVSRCPADKKADLSLTPTMRMLSGSYTGSAS